MAEKNTDPMSAEHVKDLNKAQNLAYWSFLGLFAPIAGFILGGLSLNALNTLPEEIKNQSKARSVKRLAIDSIVLSVLVAAVMIGGYVWSIRQAESQAALQANQKAAAEASAANQAEADKFLKQSVLDACLKQADDMYTQYVEANSSRTITNANGEKLYQLQQYQWDYVNGKQKTDKDECYRHASF